jgi:MarR family transcriptional regulator, organic hydroperoxide resistance regulator
MKRAADAGTSVILRHWREAVPNDRLAHLVKDATRALIRALQMRLAEHGVSFGHWTFLRILWESDGITQRKLSEEAGVMEPTTFSALKAMEKLGYITRRQTPDNRKNVYIHLTPRGDALKSRLVPLAEEVNNVAVRGLKPADIATSRRALLMIIENLARDDPAFKSLRRSSGAARSPRPSSDSPSRSDGSGRISSRSSRARSSRSSPRTAPKTLVRGRRKTAARW